MLQGGVAEIGGYLGLHLGSRPVHRPEFMVHCHSPSCPASRNFAKQFSFVLASGVDRSVTQLLTVTTGRQQNGLAGYRVHGTGYSFKRLSVGQTSRDCPSPSSPTQGFSSRPDETGRRVSNTISRASFLQAGESHGKRHETNNLLALDFSLQVMYVGEARAKLTCRETVLCPTKLQRRLPRTLPTSADWSHTGA